MQHDRPRLLAAARRLLRSQADAEDAVQDTYVRALTSLQGASPAPAWMYTVLRHVAIDRLRRRQLESAHAEEAEATPVRSSEDLVRLQADCEAALRELLGRTSLAEACALLLRDVFEFDYADLAPLVGKTESTTRQFLQRARTRPRRAGTVEVDELHVRWCWQAIEIRDPARLVHLVRTHTRCLAMPALSAAAAGRARGDTRLVQVNGRYALALMLGDTVLCVVPVGAQAQSEVSGVEAC